MPREYRKPAGMTAPLKGCVYMNISFDETRKLFRIVSGEMEYAFAVNPSGRLINLYWGAPNRCDADYDELLKYNPVINPGPRGVQRAEYPSRDRFDYGNPCLRASFDDGAQTLRLVYVSHSIDNGSLSVTLRDEYYPLEVELVYTTWGDLPLIGRRAVIKNTGSTPIRLDSAKSAAFWLPYGKKWRLTHYSGDWASEYQKQQLTLTQSRVQLETSQLTDAAAHQMPFFALDADGFKFVFDLNILTAILCTQTFAADMVAKKKGNIINISSMNAYRPLTKIPAYSSAKAGVSNLTQWLAVHFASSGIRVNAMAPGFFSTKQNEKLLWNADGTPTARTGKILAHTPMGRFGLPEDLLGTLLWLADDKASGFVTGIVVPVDGGFSAYSGV